jgi:hypothetical protein
MVLVRSRRLTTFRKQQSAKKGRRMPTMNDPYEDPMQGRTVGHDPGDDVTQGREVDEDTFDDPTQGTRAEPAPDEDPTQGGEVGEAPNDDPAQGREHHRVRAIGAMGVPLANTLPLKTGY